MCDLSYTAFNPISDIVETIGDHWDVDGDGTNESVISFDYPDGDYKGSRCSVPMLTTAETRTGELPYMPFIEVTLVDSPGAVHNISGSVRRDEAYVDLNIYATNTDEINSMDTWMQACKDQIINRIMNFRNSVSNCTWVEPIDVGREIIETTGKKTIFHHVVSLYAMNYMNG